MPSPLGHMLGGLAAGWLVAGRSTDSSVPAPRPLPAWTAPWWREAALFAAVGAAPDLDLLVGLHSMYTHSLGAVALAWLVAWIWTGRRGPRWAAAIAAAVASHILLDWLGSDTTPPIGIMALWPLTDAYYQSPLFVFMGISRRFWQAHFYVHNTRAAVRELLILLPLVLVIARLRIRRTAA